MTKEEIKSFLLEAMSVEVADKKLMETIASLNQAKDETTEQAIERMLANAEEMKAPLSLVARIVIEEGQSIVYKMASENAVKKISNFLWQVVIAQPKKADGN